jgi:hypothetical protein
MFSEYLSENLPANFTRLPQSRSSHPGSVAFHCDQLLPCKDQPSQTCGCKNSGDVEKLAIVYNMRKSGMLFWGVEFDP